MIKKEIKQNVKRIFLKHSHRGTTSRVLLISSEDNYFDEMTDYISNLSEAVGRMHLGKKDNQ